MPSCSMCSNPCLATVRCPGARRLGLAYTSSGFNDMSDIMIYRVVWGAHLCKCWKFKKEREVRVVRLFWEDRRARRVVCGEDALHTEVGDGVCKLTLPHVNKESKMAEKVSAMDGSLYVAYEENPRKRTAKANM